MPATKEQAVEHHEAAAAAFEHAAQAHLEAAKQMGSGNYEKAERYATSAVEHSEIGTRHATEAAQIYTNILDDKAQHAQELEAEAAASHAKHAAKHAAEDAS
ncbi:hypothetical protein HN018_19515 [Lichenicola cladoniae]|uniref:Uncharacterized protein n=1 Tax=Lichenicola cladoniae TaxID=1484109 RepID=A0A6M8HU84_9PROT|nr:hypothetical protein [Lichenicola cladoniae]NPD66050.1 hypothetical protein [Acetobacteraceae bacterium]QKE91928.1 hypothetical protein HN018_19515 [Lichenicola cladoniae]